MKINWGFGPPKDDDESRPSKSAGRKAGAVGGRSTSSFGGRSGRSGLGAAKPVDDADLENAPESEQHGWTSGASLTTKSIVWLMWAALIAGPLALAMLILFPDRPALVQRGGEGDRSGEVVAVSEFAERAVVAWLETPADQAASLLQYFGDINQGRPSVPWRTSRARVAEIVKDEDGLWSVIVGVDMREGRIEGRPAGNARSGAAGGAAQQPNQPAQDSAQGGAEGENDQVQRVTSGRMYFRIPILYLEGEMIAQALPAPVPAPEQVDAIGTVYEQPIGADHPAYERVRNFLNAMLVTGSQADVEAYSSPGTSFRALDPVAYAQLHIRSILRAATRAPMAEDPQDGDRADVLATVVLEGSNGQQLDAQYALVLIAREGRWEVAEMPDTPVLRAPVPVPTPTSEVAPPASGATSADPSAEGTEGSTPAENDSGTDEGGEPQGDETFTAPPATSPPTDGSE